MRVLIEGAWRDEELPQDVGRAKLTADSATVSRRTARRVRMIEQTPRPSRNLEPIPDRRCRNCSKRLDRPSSSRRH